MRVPRVPLTPELLAVMGYDLVQTQIPAVDYVHKFEQVFAFKYAFLPHSTLLPSDPDD